MRHRWTTEQLAREVGLSRSAFAERFTTLMGEPPMHYLANWRMQDAAQRVKGSHEPIARIAFETGYESEAAFNRAFKRAFGLPPVTWRNRQSA
jgi:AraC-like DNA-binding protein